MSELITKQAMKDMITNHWSDFSNEANYRTALACVDAVPPMRPKRGRWIYCEDSMADCVDGYRCDQCGLFVPWDYKHKGIDFIQDYNFCPHCGAKMEVTE